MDGVLVRCDTCNCVALGTSSVQRRPSELTVPHRSTPVNEPRREAVAAVPSRGRWRWPLELPRPLVLQCDSPSSPSASCEFAPSCGQTKTPPKDPPERANRDEERHGMT